MEQHQLVKGCSSGISDANAPLQRGLLIVPLLFLKPLTFLLPSNKETCPCHN